MALLTAMDIKLSHNIDLWTHENPEVYPEAGDKNISESM